jgi:natural product precursor
MKTLKKISLKNLSDMLSDRELKNVMGGCGGNNDCDKKSPCSEKSSGDSCRYRCNGVTLSGKCCTLQGWTEMHCSDLTHLC